MIDFEYGTVYSFTMIDFEYGTIYFGLWKLLFSLSSSSLTPLANLISWSAKEPSTSNTFPASSERTLSAIILFLSGILCGFVDDESDEKQVVVSSSEQPH